MKPRRQSEGPRNISGQRISQARLAHHPELSQISLSQCLATQGIYLDQSTISRIESQDRRLTDIELLSIARCLHVSVAWLCGEKGKAR